MAEFVVASEAVASTARRMSGYRSELATGAGNAARLVYSVCSVSWTGQAADEFARLWYDWNANAEVVHDALGQMARVLNDTAAEYAETEAGVTSMSESMSGHAPVAGARVADTHRDVG